MRRQAEQRLGQAIAQRLGERALAALPVHRQQLARQVGTRAGHVGDDSGDLFGILVALRVAQARVQDPQRCMTQAVGVTQRLCQFKCAIQRHRLHQIVQTLGDVLATLVERVLKQQARRGGADQLIHLRNRRHGLTFVRLRGESRSGIGSHRSALV